MRDLSRMDEAERAEAQADRIEELEDSASDLRRRSRNWWKPHASLGLSILGGLWSLSSGDFLGPLITGGQELLKDKPGSVAECDAYSYLFRAERRFGT